MKTKFATIKSLGGYLRFGAAVGAVLLSCGAPLHTRAAAFDSPVGQSWDVVMGGRHQGLGVFIFTDDGSGVGGTFSVESILIPKPLPAPSSSSDDSRNPGGDESRGGVPSPGNTNVITLPAHTNIFGLVAIPRPDNPPGTAVEPGQWGFDAKGRLVGYYTDVSAYSVCVTNEVLINTGIGIVTNFVVECSRVTNAISFVGTVVAGKRLTLVASTPDGRSVFTGVPVSASIPDVSGQYSGKKIENPLVNNEFFSLASNGSANSYTIEGMGPGYIYEGRAFLSKSGKFAVAAIVNPPITVTDNETELVWRSVFGSLNKQKFTFSTTGFEQASGELDNHVRFTGVRTATPD